MSDTLVVNEVYLSVQGESTFSGLPCIFIRLTGCGLRCSYCDTAYAFKEGERTSVGAVMEQVSELRKQFGNRQTALKWRLPLVELTGGEPLLQKNSLPLMKALCDSGDTVLLETSGAYDISQVDPRVHRIVDLKCPSSGEEHRNRWANLSCLTPEDEIKFVIATEEDYGWARTAIESRNLTAICPLLLSWASPLSPEQQDSSLKALPAGQRLISRTELAERIIADALPVRFQIQIHKIVWSPEARGV